MRNLALRFVRNLHPEKFVHVVDPNFDLRNHLKDPDLFQKELQDRRVKGLDAVSLHHGFQKWWNSYSDLLQAEEKTPEYREMKDKLLDQDTTLLDVLKLPNRIDIGPHFLEATPSQKWKIPDFQVHSSLSKTVDEMENLIFEGTKVMRLDPPRFCRPAVTEAFNLDSNEIIQIHEGQNLPMNLMGISPPGLLVTFVATKFDSSNDFPLSFIAKGAGYSRSYRGWQRHFVSIVILDPQLLVVHSTLNSFRLSLERSLSSLVSPSTVSLLPHELRLYEASAAITSLMSKPVIRYSSCGTYLSERLKIIGDSNDKANPKFMNIGFLEIDCSTLNSLLLKK